METGSCGDCGAEIGAVGLRGVFSLRPGDDRIAEWIAQVENLEKLPGYGIEIQLRHLNMSWELFAKNYDELSRVLAVFSDPVKSLRLWDVRNTDNLNVVLQEITRLLFNMTAAAMMLVDHTRVKVNEMHSGTPFIEEYQAEVSKRFVESPLHCFIKGLRNFFTHKELPFVNAELTLEFGSTLSSRVALNVIQLQGWDKWDRHARRYLESVSDGRIDVYDLVQSYFDHVKSFHQWLRTRQIQIFESELQELSRRRKQLRRLREEMRNSKEQPG